MKAQTRIEQAAKNKFPNDRVRVIKGTHGWEAEVYPHVVVDGASRGGFTDTPVRYLVTIAGSAVVFGKAPV